MIKCIYSFIQRTISGVHALHNIRLRFHCIFANNAVQLKIPCLILLLVCSVILHILERICVVFAFNLSQSGFCEVNWTTAFSLLWQNRLQRGKDLVDRNREKLRWTIFFRGRESIAVWYCPVSQYMSHGWAVPITIILWNVLNEMDFLEAGISMQCSTVQCYSTYIPKLFICWICIFQHDLFWTNAARIDVIDYLIYV